MRQLTEKVGPDSPFLAHPCQISLVLQVWGTEGGRIETQRGKAKECSNHCTIALVSRQQSNAQNSPSQASTIHEPRTSSCFSWMQKKQRNRDQIVNIRWIIEKAREFQKNICFIEYAKAFDCVDHNKLSKILKEIRIPDHLTCLLRNLYIG